MRRALAEDTALTDLIVQGLKAGLERGSARGRCRFPPQWEDYARALQGSARGDG
jgi:hypothetical protein